MSDKLTDTQKFWLDLRNAGEFGIHSWEPRYSKNISQRSKDCTTKGQQVYKRTERRNGRPGTRYWLDGFQPPDATPVKPNFDAEGSHTASSDARVMEQTPRVAPLGAEPVALFDPYTYERRGRYGDEEAA